MKNELAMEKLAHVLERIGSRLFAKLWGFYRDYFRDDDTCLQFLYDTLLEEPVIGSVIYNGKEDEPGCLVDDKGNVIHDAGFISRRMLNTVERLVSAARDMEMIRRGKDVFKIVFIVTCVETLQKLAGKDRNEKGKDISKKELLFNFFEQYTLDADKKYIAERFAHNDEEVVETEDSFQQFVGVLNEYRNCAAHEGDYWSYCFNKNYHPDGYPLSFDLRIDLERFSGNNKQKKEHSFQTRISYSEFEKIFVRTCIAFIKDYVAERAASGKNKES